MKVKILEGKPFDWEEAEKHVNKYIETRPEFAAAGADPGVMSCPNCNEMYWKEGSKVQCTKCNHIWEVEYYGIK